MTNFPQQSVCQGPRDDVHWKNRSRAPRRLSGVRPASVRACRTSFCPARPDVRPEATVRADAQGRFTLGGLTPGPWLIEASGGEGRLVNYLPSSPGQSESADVDLR